MARTQKSWQEKLAAAKAKPDLPKKFFCKQSRQNFVVPSVGEVEAIIAKVRRGRVVTIAEICGRLKQAHRVDVACPIATGIFTWIIAHAAQEALDRGAKRGVPWWRVLKTGGVLNLKYPGAGKLQKTLLQKEGHRVVRKGKNFSVVGRAALPSE